MGYAGEAKEGDYTHGDTQCVLVSEIKNAHLFCCPAKGYRCDGKCLKVYLVCVSGAYHIYLQVFCQLV